MGNDHSLKEFELICVIVNFGLGTRVIKIASKNGVSGGTILLGKGTVRNRILEFLDLYDVRKEIILMVSEKKTAHEALEALDKQLHLRKPDHGIAFSTSVQNFLGTGNYEYKKKKESRGGENIMYNAIFVIVDRGKAESVMDVATKSGSRGGTIINARGSGIHETQKLFAIEIEPEKEIVLIIVKNEITELVVTSIRDELKIDEPGTGIIFVQEVSKAYGIL
jgi:nitrogen regulatory protein PII